VRWVRASYPALHDLLTNPVYAGAFAFGRTREEKHLGADGRVRVRRVALPLSTSAPPSSQNTWHFAGGRGRSIADGRLGRVRRSHADGLARLEN
jgi:hypothetical protein